MRRAYYIRWVISKEMVLQVTRLLLFKRDWSNPSFCIFCVKLGMLCKTTLFASDCKHPRRGESSLSSSFFNPKLEFVQFSKSLVYLNSQGWVCSELSLNFSFQNLILELSLSWVWDLYYSTGLEKNRLALKNFDLELQIFIRLQRFK